MSVAIWAHEKYTGRCQTFMNDVPSLDATLVGNDNLSSLLLNTTCDAMSNLFTKISRLEMLDSTSKMKIRELESLAVTETIEPERIIQGWNDDIQEKSMKWIPYVAPHVVAR